MRKNMLLNFIKDVKLNYFLVITILSCLLYCNNHNGNEKHIVLFLDSKNSNYTDERFLIDSINIEYGDSVSMFFNTGGDTTLRVFHEYKNGLYEIRERFNEIPDREYLGIDTILSFSKLDTTFIYHSAFDFIPLVFYYSFADCKYEISKEKNVYKTIKTSLLDTTYKEIFFYDKDYHIYKFINTYKDNYCVYIKKE